MDEEVSAQQVFDVLEKARSKEVEEIVLFDLYRGPGIPEGKKSLAIRARYRSLNKTLTDAEIGTLHGRIVKAMEKNLGAEVR